MWKPSLLSLTLIGSDMPLLVSCQVDIRGPVSAVQEERRSPDLAEVSPRLLEVSFSYTMEPKLT